jgi:hypothetical protein
MDHVISANESETIKVAIKTMDWAGKITDLFHYGNKEAIHQAVLGLRNRFNREFDATILLDQLDQLDQQDQHKAPDAHWIFTSPAAIIGAAICLFGLGYCLWKCCSQTATMVQPQPSARPMPMPMVQPQPASTIRKMQNNGPKNNCNLNDRIAKNNTINQHHDHLKTSKRRTPRKGRDIGNNIFVNSVKL